MRIVFCDDDDYVLAQLQKYVLEFFYQLGGELPFFSAYNNGEDLIAHEKYLDIAFLDVEMHGISGISVGAKLKEINPKIKIFIITSFPDYLDEAMRFDVYRYLSKPINKNRLFRNLKDALFQYNMESEYYPIETAEGIFTRRSDEIVCVECFQRNVLILLLDTTLKSSRPFSYWREKLTLPCFFYSHRSYIINLKYVYMATKDTITLKYNDKLKTAYLAKRNYKHFKDVYLLYLESTKR